MAHLFPPFILPPLSSTLHPDVNTSNHWCHQKHKTKRKRYWRSDNHMYNIQLATYAVINLNNAILTHNECPILASGISFSPTPRNVNWSEVRDYATVWVLSQLPPSTNSNPFHPKGTCTLPITEILHSTLSFLDAVKHDLLSIKPCPVHDKLNTHERHACNLLGRHSEIVIKFADKGSGFMDRD